jgi:hypothetical protein
MNQWYFFRGGSGGIQFMFNYMELVRKILMVTKTVTGEETLCEDAPSAEFRMNCYARPK